MNKTLVLDFDGTITDAEKEGGPFRGGYLEDVAHLCGLPIDEALRLADGFEDEVRANPKIHGWIFDGQIVAPATVDPYLRMMPVARKLMDHAGVFSSPVERDRLLDGILYKYNYPKTKTAFRDGAYECLHGLTGTHTYVVTNSHTTPVQGKVGQLQAENGPNTLDWLIKRVHGRAKKYVLDHSFTEVPESISLPELDRPVLLRRKHYYSVLAELLRTANSDWENLTVVGDIFELDLALPLALGARVGLVVNPFTPDYEKTFVESHPRGQLIHGLDEVAAFAFEV
jgi:hypothetical protein